MTGSTILLLWTALTHGTFGSQSTPAPFYSSDPYPGYTHAVTQPLTGFDDRRLLRRPNEEDMVFAVRVNRAVFYAVFHCLDNQASQSWLIALLTGLQVRRPETEGLLTPRGLRCGLCSQVAYIVARALRHGGLDAEPFGLNGHVVTRFSIGGRDYLIDPDYGVGPFDLASPHAEAILRAAYFPIRARFRFDDGTTLDDFIVKTYLSQADNHRYYDMAILDEMADKQERLIKLQAWLENAMLAISLCFVGLGVLNMSPRKGLADVADGRKQTA